MSDGYVQSIDSSDYNRVMTNSGVRKSASGRFRAYPGGLYDPAIFGKEFFDKNTRNPGAQHKCTCGTQTSPGRCPSCHELLLPTKEYYTKGGYYQFCVPFVGKLVEKLFVDAISNIVDIGFVKGLMKKYDLDSVISAIWCCEFKLNRINSYTNPKGVIKKSGFNYTVETTEAEEGSIITSCGLLGIYKIITDYKPASGGMEFDKIKRYINYNLFITPVHDRPFSINHNGEPEYPPITQAYAQLIQLDKIAKQVIFGDGGPEGKLIDKLAISASISTAISRFRDTYLGIFKTSKESTHRYAGTGRVPCSLRANIISAKTPLNTILLPKAAAYIAVKDELKKRLLPFCNNSNTDAEDLYNDPTDKVMEIFEDLIENSVGLFGRQPTLYKHGMLAFKCRLWKESDFSHPVDLNRIACIGMNIGISTPFNADFDGDQMYCDLFTTSPAKEEVYRKAGIENNWIYPKNNESVFVPKKSILAGLHVGTKIYKSNYPIPEEYKFKTFATIQRLYNNKQIMFNTPLEFNGELTCYGILKISDILHHDLKKILEVESNEQIDINSKSMKLISMYIRSMPDKVEAVSQLIDLGSEWIKQYGSSLIRLSELYKVDTKFPKIEEILNSKRSEKEKFILLDKQLSNIILSSIKDSMPGLSEEMDISGVKKASVVAMIQPTISFGSSVKISDRSLLAGLGEEEFVNHAATTREILKQKASLVPLGGYINKCVTDCLSNYTYKANEKSQDVKGILIKKKDAIGRVDMNDKPIGYNDSSELVRVKSCIYDLNSSTRYHVAGDEINQELYNIENNAPLGILSANSTTEEITQSQLALKHGGHLFSPSLECIVAHEDLKVIEITDQNITLARGADRYIYPLPKQYLLSLECIECLQGKRSDIKKGEVVFYIDEMQYVDLTK